MAKTVAITGLLLTALTAVANPVWAFDEIENHEAHAAAKQAWETRYERDIFPLLKTYCGDCHTGAQPDGDVDLGQLTTGADAYARAGLLENMLQRVRRGEMPPEGSTPVPDHRVVLLTDVLAQRPRQNKCNVVASDETAHWYRGYVMGRRITRAEYNAMIRDLTGLDLRPADDFPVDAAGGEGFDTHGATLYSSPILAEQLLAAADTVIEAAVPCDTGACDSVSTPAQEMIFVSWPDEIRTERDAAREIVGTFATRAYRRPVNDTDLDRLLTLYDVAREHGRDFVTAVKTPLKAVLLSPKFLFIDETFDGEGGIGRISPHQMAERLSLLLWSSMPDDELLAVADDDTIFEQHVLEQQIRRMLADHKSRALAENFGLQWLGLTELTTLVRPDTDAFPSYTPELARAMREEVVANVHDVFRHGRPLTQLIDRRELFVNESLARHYSLSGIEGDHIRVVLSDDPVRGGLLTTAGVLTATSYPHRTSPVLRGKWVLETLLGERVPPPPPGTPTLEEHADVNTSSLRERLEQHRVDPKCSSCHSRMDPLGFGLEHFDPIGHWRNDDHGHRIDASGRLPNGQTFRGAIELKRVLLEQRQRDFVTNITRKLLGYALGRELNEFDQCVVRRTVSRLEDNELRADVLVSEIVRSYPFQHRYWKK